MLNVNSLTLKQVSYLNLMLSSCIPFWTWCKKNGLSFLKNVHVHLGNPSRDVTQAGAFLSVSLFYCCMTNCNKLSSCLKQHLLTVWQCCGSEILAQHGWGSEPRCHKTEIKVSARSKGLICRLEASSRLTWLLAEFRSLGIRTLTLVYLLALIWGLLSPLGGLLQIFSMWSSP